MSQQDFAALRLDVRADGDGASIALRGEVDRSTVALLEGALHGLQKAGVRRFTLEMSNLRFMDSNGVAAVYRLLKEEPDAEVRCIGCSSSIEYILQLTGLGDLVRWSR